MKNQIKISKENTLLITSMEQLLTQIDTIKEKITDQEYRDMMDSLKTLHDKQPDFKYDVVIAHIENNDKDINCRGIEYHIHKMVLIPKEFVGKDTESIKRLIEDTKKGGGILDNPIPLWVDFRKGTIRFEWELPNSICNEEEENIVALYQEFTLLAVREIKD